MGLFVHGGAKKQFYDKGVTVFAEGDPGDAMFIMESGRVSIFKEIEGETVRLATLSSGELFGEMALIDGSPRMATAIADEDSVIVKIPSELMEAKLKGYDKFLRGLLKILINNLRKVHNTYMHRARSVDDYLNAIAFHVDGFKQYLEKPESEELDGNARNKLEELDQGIKRLREMAAGHQDRRHSVLTDADLSRRKDPGQAQ